MVDGEFLYASSGVSFLGMTKSGEVRISRPALFIRVKEIGGSNSWAAYELNSYYQGNSVSVMYTLAYGKSVTMEYYLFKEDPKGFRLDDDVSIISCAPRLVRRPAPSLPRWSRGLSRYASPPIPRPGPPWASMVSVPGGATIQQMRE